MPISDWPEDERPREKLLTKGASSLSNAELLAIFLRTGTRGKTAVDLSRDLLSEFNGRLRNIIEADADDFCKIKGVGIAKYTHIQAAGELGKRCLEEKMEGKDVISSPEDTKNFVLARLRGYPQEVFACLFLDSQHQVICFEEMFSGTINSANVYPREVVKKVLEKKATAVIFAHNHPSGLVKPSTADKKITRRLQDALNLIDVRVLDHLIIGDNETFSFAEAGLI